MRTPHRVNASIGPKLVETATIADTSNPGAFGAGVAKSLQGLGVDIEAASKVLGQKEKDNKNFRQLSAMTNFENNINAKLIEAKRNAPVDGKGYLDSINNMYEKEAQSFLANEIDPEDREQFQFRTDQIKQRVIGDSLEFQYKASDNYFRQGLSDELNKGMSKIALDPSATDSVKADMFAKIDTQTDLSEIEKAELKRNINVGLLKTEYLTTARDAQIATGVSGNSVAQTFVNKVVGAESGGDDNAKADTSSATGAGQFLKGTWIGMMKKYRPDLVAGMSKDDILDLRKNGKLSREMVLRYAEENQATMERAGITPTEGALYLGHFLGPGDAVKVLKSAPGTPIRDVVTPASIAANPAVFNDIQTVEQLQAWAGKKMGSASSKIMADPRYQDIPFEDKLALQADADAQAKAAIAQQKQDQKLAYDTRFNTMMVGIIDGKVGMTEIQAARDEGWLKDYSDISTATNAVKAKNKDMEDVIAGYAKFNNPGSAYTGDAEDQKQLNAMVKSAGGLEQLVAGNQEYFTNGIVPIVARTNIIPSDVVSTLSTLVRGNNQQQSMFALDALAQLEDANPRAFAAQVNDALANDVTIFRDRRDRMPADELMKVLNPPVDAAGLNIQKELRKQSKTILAGNVQGNAKLTVIDNIINEYQETVGGQVANVGGARNGLNKDFSVAFEDAYVKTGNVETATKTALAQLDRTWGVTSVGGQNTLMKLPPEKAGYKPLAGSFNWIDRQARAQLKTMTRPDGTPMIPEGGRYELISDGQTQREFDRWKGGPQLSGTAQTLAEAGGMGGPIGGLVTAASAALSIAAAPPPPSYRLVTYDEAGVPNAVTINGSPLRMNFLPDTADILQEQADYDWNARREVLKEELLRYNDLTIERMRSGKEIPPEEEEAYQAARKELNEMSGKRPALRNPEDFRTYGEVDYFSEQGAM